MTLIDLGLVKGDKGDTGNTGAKGDTGNTGTGIESIEQIDNDTFRICLTDGTSYDIDMSSASVNIDTSFPVTLSDSHVPSTKLVKNTIDTKQATLVSGTNIKTINNESLLGSGNISVGGSSVDIVTSWESTLSDTKVPSEKLTKNTIDGLNIPTKISDLTNDSDFIETSSTSGLIKNDGTIMTSGTGSTNYSAGNHTHSGYVSATKVTSWSSTVSDSNVPSEKLVKDSLDVKVNTSDIANNLTTTTAGKVLDARQGKALADLIGDAITYINQ